MGYLVFCLYAYQVMEQEKDYKTIWYGIVAVFIVMAVLGIFQIAKKDLLDFAWMQRLVMSKEQFAEYGGTLETIFSGNNVFLSLYNPNYAGVFLTMFAPVFCSDVQRVKREKKKEEDFLRDIVCRMSDPDLVYLLPLHIFCIACGISRRMYPF